jgi:hypothetical protein
MIDLNSIFCLAYDNFKHQEIAIFSCTSTNDGGELLVLHLLGKLLSTLDDIGNITLHVKSRFRKGIVLALENLLEGTDGVGKRDKTTLITSENLSDSEGLGQETLDLTSTLDSQLVFFRQFVHTENGNDILERLVVLEDLLDTSGDVIVLLTDDTGIEDTRLGVKRIDGRVDTQFGNTTGQDSGGVLQQKLIFVKC